MRSGGPSGVRIGLGAGSGKTTLGIFSMGGMRIGSGMLSGGSSLGRGFPSSRSGGTSSSSGASPGILDIGAKTGGALPPSLLSPFPGSGS